MTTLTVKESPPAPPAGHRIGPVQWSDRALLVLILVAGFALGLAPFCLFVQRPQWLAYAGLFAAVFFAFRVKTGLDGERALPSALDRVLGAVSAVYPPVLLGALLGLTYFGVGWLTVWLNWAIRFLDPDFGLPVRKIALTASVLALILGGFGFLSVTWQEIAKKLYPKPSERGTPLMRLSRRRRLVLATVFLTVVFLVSFFLAAFWFEALSTRRYVFLQLALMFPTLLVWSEVQGSNLRVKALTAVDTVETLLMAAGFTLEKIDGSDLPEAPGVLRQVDYFAEGHDRKLVIDVRTGRSGPVDWSAVSALGTAAWALAEARSESAYDVEPVLVLVDAHEHEGLAQAAREEGVHILRLSESSIERALDSNAGEEAMRSTAIELLRDAMDEGRMA